MADHDGLMDAVTAARELSHAACHLADIAAKATQHSQIPEIAHAGRLSLEASIRAAQRAFALDDLLSTRANDAALLWLAVEAIAAAQETVEVAREALEATLPESERLGALRVGGV